MKIIYKTGTGNQYPVEILHQIIQPSEIPYNRQKTLAACQKGCSLFNRNGGCPPFAPDFLRISKNYQKALFVLAKLHTENFPPRVLQGPYYVRWVFTESTITRLLDRLGRELVHQLPSAAFLGSGHCIGCKNKKCALKLEIPRCTRPKDRTFSLEATGVLVTELVERLFGFPLHWWDRDNMDYIPPYMCKVVCLLAHDGTEAKIMQSYVETYLSHHYVQVKF